MDYLNKLFGIKNKVIIVTGGLGILGTQYCKALVQAGARVCVYDISLPEDQHELKQINNGSQIHFFAVDVTNKDEVKEATSKVIKEVGVPEGLINNAALDNPPGSSSTSFEDYPLEQWDKVLSVSLTGMMVCCQIIGGEMAKAGKGSIVNISSTYGLVSPDQRIYDNFIKPVSYSVAKSGVYNFTRYLATYWAAKGIRVNTLTPGGVEGTQSLEFKKKYSDKTPLARMANKEEYNGAIIFLLSDASSYMTGSNLIIDGGWTAW